MNLIIKAPVTTILNFHSTGKHKYATGSVCFAVPPRVADITTGSLHTFWCAEHQLLIYSMGINSTAERF